MRTRPACLLVSLLLAAACSPASDAGSSGDHPGTITSLAAPSAGHAIYLALGWQIDGDQGDGLELGDKVRLQDARTVPRSFALPFSAPREYTLDLDAIRALPLCSASQSAQHCWDDAKPRPQGHGKLAVGVFLVFEDLDDDGQARFSGGGTGDHLLGYSTLFVLHAQGLDAQAIKYLGELLLNPQALQPGFNFARVRCKAKAHWTGEFDPFEIVGPQDSSLVIESPDVLNARLQSGELCNNWS
jgi:hypothetical protein